MGSYITLIYMVFLICSPAVLFPELARYRVQWWVGGLALTATLPMVLMYGYPLRNRQISLVVLFMGQIMLSRIMRGWFGGALFAMIEFGSTVIVFFLLVAGAPSLARLRRISLFLVVPALYAGLRGILALYAGWQTETYVLHQNVYTQWTIIGVVDRIRFLGYFNDPNDLAQYFLVCLPLIGLMWRKNAMSRNLLLVAPLFIYILIAMYLTHSRGVLVGLVVLLMVYFAERFNRTLAIIGSVIFGVALMGANFAGGRAISFGQGADRIEAWGASLTMLRQNPLFGVGYNLFGEYNALTAHNSFVLCFAELGLIGFFIWLGLLVTTFLSLNQLIARLSSLPHAADAVRWAKALRMALAGFLATSWFLSRTYSILLYVLLAMVVILDMYCRSTFPVTAAVRPAAASPVFTPPQGRRGWHWAQLTIGLQFVCIVVIYMLVRARWSN